MMSPPTCSKKPPSCLVPSQWSPRNPCDLSGSLRLRSPAGAKPNSPARENGPESSVGFQLAPTPALGLALPQIAGTGALMFNEDDSGGGGTGGTSEPGLTEGGRP